MNRLIIIGNGFDLAHDLKSKYSDFLSYWILQELDNIKNYKGNSESVERMQFVKDSFASISLQCKLGYSMPNQNFIAKYNYYLGQLNLSNENIKDYINKRIEFQEPLDTSNAINIHIRFNGLIKDLIEKDPENWSTIESIYYNKLKAAANVDKVRKLNQQLLEFQIRFVNYLIDLKHRADKSNLPLLNKFREKSLTNHEIQKSLILSFNYTNIIDFYYNHLKKEFPLELIKIHGDMNDQIANPIIFGYGDEHDDDYKKIEKNEYPESLEFIKSMKYFLSGNYKDLINFLKEDRYEVFVIGHSCGLTDKTLLKYIFEDGRCDLIYPFFHDNRERYFSNVKSISRHFKNKITLRERIVHLNPNNYSLLNLS